MDDPSDHSTPSGTASAAPASGTQPPQPSQSYHAAVYISNSKRRRGLGQVTPNACTECRKKRAKCDGQTPCGRCKSQKDVECIYEIPIKQSKETLRTEIEQLRKHQHSTDNVLAALAGPDLWEDVLQRLRSGQSVEAISEWLSTPLPPDPLSSQSLSRQQLESNPSVVQISISEYSPNTASFQTMGLEPPINTNTSQVQPNGQDQDQSSPWGYSQVSQGVSSQDQSHPDLVNRTPDGPDSSQASVGSWVRGLTPDQPGDHSQYRGLDQVISVIDTSTQVPANAWTNVTNDAKLVKHLLSLYFCWEYPTFASLSKEHFLKDFEEGRHRFCSPILVNALLALGCRFSSQPDTRANPNDPYSAGDHFFNESLRLFSKEENHHSLTTIQALGIMSIREASRGRDSESWYYAGQSVRLATEMGLHMICDQGDEDELAVKSATFWGAFALDHAWSLSTGSLPQCSCFPHLPPKPGIIVDIEASLWIPYTDDGQPLQRSCEQPSNVRSVYKCFCELSELVHQSLYVLHSPGRPLTSRDLLNIYTQYLNWYDRIPEVLRLGHIFTPAVLFAHMYYHFAILLLFRPLIKLKIIGSSISPRDVCSQAADAIQGLLRSYSQLYTLRRTPSFVPYFVLTASIMHLAIAASSSTSGHINEESFSGAASQSPPNPQQLPSTKIDPGSRVSSSINQGIADLTEMAPCHYFAEQALNILRYLAKKWRIDADMEKSQQASDDSDRLVRLRAGRHNFFAPNVVDSDVTCSWGSGSSAVAGAPVRQTPVPMENPLFWPFPMQGRPMLPCGQTLAEAGFELI